MEFIETVKGLISREEVKNGTENFLSDALDAVLGNPVAAAKIMVSFLHSPLFLREQIFWTKMEAFLNGTYLNEDDCDKLREKITDNSERQDNTLRLLECIDRAETQQKIQYIINATRYLLMDFIDRPMYFRICHALTYSLEEDLEFLSEHIEEKDLSYSVEVQGLLATGLMYQSVIDAKNEQKYSFTPLAEIVDQYALSCNNSERYPITEQLRSHFNAPQSKLLGVLDWEPITAEDIDTIVSKNSI